MKSFSYIPLKRSQLGVSLIEALVSMTLFAFGVLGMSKMQTSALVQVDDTRQHLIAAWKAQDLVDRIRATRTLTSPAGMADMYVASIGGNVNTIGKDVAAQVFECPNNPPARSCARRNNGGGMVDAEICTDQELVDYDIWETFCDPQTGLVTNAADAVGSQSLQSMEIVMTSSDTTVANPGANGGGNKTTREYFLYVEWVSATADQNTSQANAITQNLCGDDVAVDASVNVYCLKFR